MKRFSGALTLSLVCASLFFANGLRAADQGQPHTVYDPAHFDADDQALTQPSVSVTGFAIDNKNHRIAWRDNQNRLWLATFDAEDGSIQPADGKGLLIDSGLISRADSPIAAAWAFGSDGVHLVYTKELEDGFHLARATETPDGAWQSELLEGGQNRVLLYGTSYGNAEPAYISFIDFDQQRNKLVGYRAVGDVATAGVIADTTAEGGPWHPGGLTFALTTERSGTSAAAVFEVSTGRLTVVTDGFAAYSNPVVWKDPQTELDTVAVVADGTAVDIFHDLPGTGWTRSETLSFPTRKIFVNSLDAFVYRGRSYVTSVVAAASAGLSPSEVWVSGVGSQFPFYREASDPETTRLRLDPSMLTTYGAPRVVYSQFDSQTKLTALRIANTGLLTDWGYESPFYGGPWALIHRGNRNTDAAPFKIHDAYEEVYVTVLPHMQVVRPPIGPDGHLYLPYFEEFLDGQKTGRRFLGGYDTRDFGAEVFKLGTDITGDNLTAGTPLIHSSGDFFFAGADRVGRYLADGTQLWTAPIRGVPTSFQFAPDGNLVLFSWNGWAYIVDPETGNVLRERNMAEGRTFPDKPYCLVLGGSPDCAYVNTPAVDPFKGVIYNTYNNAQGVGSVHAYNYRAGVKDLRVRWRQPSLEGGSASSPVISSDYKRIYVHDRAGNLIALDADNGDVVWTFAIGFIANASPNVNDNGFIVPGGSQTDPEGYNYVGLIKDYGDYADFAFRTTAWTPASAAVAGADDTWAIYAHPPGDDDDLHLLIYHPERGIISATPWQLGVIPRRLTALSLREDGWMFANMHGVNGFKALRPVEAGLPQN